MAGIAYVFLIVLVFKTGESLKCYECYSENNANCAKDFKGDKIKTVECTKDNVADNEKQLLPQLAGKEPKFSCLARGITAQDKMFVTRSCSIAKSVNANPCQKEDNMATQAHIKEHFCFMCEKDLCNGNGALVSSLMFVTISCLVNVLLKYVFA